MPVTIKDVAREAGVSISTVSRVINNSKPVSASIKKKVQKVIDKTGYVPNPVARSLVMKKSQIIGVIVPGISEYYVGEFLNGVEEIARMYHYDIVLCNSYGESDKEDTYLDLLFSKQAAAIIVVSTNLRPETIETIQKHDIPFAYCSPNSNDFSKPASIGVDLAKATEDFIKVLAEGKSDGKIVYVCPYSADENIKDHMEKYLRKAFKNLNLKAKDYKFLKFANTEKDMYNIAKEMLTKKPNSVSAFICPSDKAVLDCYHALTELGLKVPEDVKLASLFESGLTSSIRPEVYYIRRPLYDMGAVAARMTVKQIDKIKLDSNHIFLPYSIMLGKNKII